MYAVEILVPLAFFATAFGIVYIVISARNRERMALIESGQYDDLFKKKKKDKGSTLKNGLFLVGVAIGLGLGKPFSVLIGASQEIGYIATVTFFGGLSLVLYYFKFMPQSPSDDDEVY